MKWLLGNEKNGECSIRELTHTPSQALKLEPRLKLSDFCYLGTWLSNDVGEGSPFC